MRVITAKRIWEAKARWPQSASALDEWYPVQRLYIRHVLDHRDYDKDKWKE